MKITPLKGTRDILPSEQRIRDFVQNTILETYKNNGFERISTPILEDIENLNKSEGGDNLNLIFKVLKRGEKLNTVLTNKTIQEKDLTDIGLRYDLTLPLTRFFAANKDKLQYPFKVIQTDKVFRAERPQKGRLREFTQCDIDIFGDDSPNAEIELINITAQALLNIGFDNFIININDRKILRDIFKNMGFAEESLDTVCISFDKMDKIGTEGIIEELKEKHLPENAIDNFIKFISENLTLDSIASKCSDLTAVNKLKYIISTIEKVAKEKYKIKYSPCLVRGQGYYTDTIFEIESQFFSGAIGGGGRYNSLTNKFIGQQIPAVGFSIGFERLCNILLENNYEIPKSKEKCALLYDDSIDFSQVLLAAEELKKEYNIAIIRKNKKPGPQYNMLENQGYTKFATFKDEQVILK